MKRKSIESRSADSIRKGSSRTPPGMTYPDARPAGSSGPHTRPGTRGVIGTVAGRYGIRRCGPREPRYESRAYEVDDDAMEVSLFRRSVH